MKSILVLAFIATAATAQAQERPARPDLTLPTAVFAAAATADWATSHALIGRGGLRDGDNATRTVSKGIAIDVAGVALWNRYVGRKHPRIAKAGLYIASAVRIGFAVKAMRTCQPTCMSDFEQNKRAFRAQFGRR